MVSADLWRAEAFLLTNFVAGIFWLPVFLAVIWLATETTILSMVMVVLIVLWLRRPRAARWRVTLSWLAQPFIDWPIRYWVAGARFERWRIHLFYGITIPPPHLAPLPGARFGRRYRLSDPAVWRDLFYLALLCPLGAIEAIIVVVSLIVPLALLTLPLYYFLIPGGVPLYGAPDTERATGWSVDTLWEAMVAGGVGLLIVVPASLLAIRVAHDHLRFAQRLLGPSDQTRLAARVEVLTRSRSRVMEAQLAERQRIERDLHDGAQQRLVSLAMDLGMAKEKLRTDPEAANALVAAAHEESKRVLSDLRELVRGIHPAVLTDRGLDAAISAIAARSPVPVSVDVRLDGRLPEGIEAAAYFVVVEALTNVTKHSGAKEARVAISRHGGDLVIEIVDDGQGGALPDHGTGLAGLRDRLAALDGSLNVHSPPGGPTWIRAEIPRG